MRPGRFIAQQRERAGLTQDELARRAFYSRAHVAGVEAGVYRPSVAFLRAVANALGIPVTWFLTTIQPNRPADVPAAIRRAAELSSTQKAALLNVYNAYREAS